MNRLEPHVTSTCGWLPIWLIRDLPPAFSCTCLKTRWKGSPAGKGAPCVLGRRLSREKRAAATVTSECVRFEIYIKHHYPGWDDPHPFTVTRCSSVDRTRQGFGMVEVEGSPPRSTCLPAWILWITIRQDRTPRTGESHFLSDR
jgi:hypothetical protein